MPELPEVETTLRGIEPHILNKEITSITVRNTSLRWPVPVNSLKTNLVSNSFSSIKRRGKYLILESQKGFVLIHLGMSGCLRIFDNKSPHEKHDHVDVSFDDNSILRYTDPRRFGSFLWTTEPDSHVLISKLGPEPLGNKFSGTYLFEKSRKKKLPVKNFIMDSQIVVGVGNIYASEALFLAGIRPKKYAGKVTHNQYESLALEIRNLLNKSIEKGGTTLRDFLGGDSQPGYFKQQLNVYGRSGQECKVCQSILKNLKIGQRGSVYCPKCQN
ncbi:bifunctional DNA-formamidopyrimidine glycosylase/DNA-(apurinic or apyrimidinic site) lyase [Gammaproteobacteria bacterium]|nr:bifunctional DNA-formamidopyrimidine glycosylase/DNA-(apurinic or apyrimidinic site) lyase [Gammaproteobacteria bacterium]